MNEEAIKEPMRKCDHCLKVYASRLIYLVRHEHLCSSCGQKQIDQWNSIVRTG